MKKFKMTKERWCTLAQVAYHIVFAGGMFGGGMHYLDEFQKTRDTIVQQVDRAETLVERLETNVTTNVNKVAATVKSTSATISKTGKAISSTGDKVDRSADELKDVLKKVKKACRF